MAQEFGFALRPLDLALVLGNGCLGGAPRLPQAADLVGLLVEPTERVEQTPVRGRINERALIMLTVNLDQYATKIFQHLDADRLIVDESACASIGKLNPSKNQLVLKRDIVVAEQCACRMVARNIEGCRHLPL